MKYQQPYGITDPDAPYINGDPSIGRAGSIPPAAAFEYPMREIVHLIQKAGITASDNDLFQLLKAVRYQTINYVVDHGIINQVAGVLDPVLDDYKNGLPLRVKVAFRNTGATQANFGPGWADVVHVDGTNLIDGDIVPGGIAVMVYVEGKFQLLNPHVYGIVTVTGAPVTGGGNTYQTINYMGFQGLWAREHPGTYSWTVPAGVRKVWTKIWAGGGPGVEWVQDGSFIKGGDGGYAEKILDVVPGDLMQIVVGAGAPPPVAPSNGNITYNATNWKATYGGQSSIGVTGQPAMMSATGGRGCYPNPPGDTDPSPGEPGHGVNGDLTRANGLYGKGGGWNQSSDGVRDDYLEDTGEDGAAILVF